MPIYKNLIFDIGNVLVDIDFDVVVAEFQKIAAINFHQILSYSRQSQLFDQFDRGHVSPAQFREELRKHLKPGITDEQINAAWNAILISYPTHKFELLRKLKQNYKVYALSNINEIHIESIDKVAQQKFGEKDFASFFHTAYYSNELGHRKPDKEIYEHIIQKEKLIPSETFFVDDKEENIETAKKLGLQAYQLKHPGQLITLLTELHII